VFTAEIECNKLPDTVEELEVLTLSVRRGVMLKVNKLLIVGRIDMESELDLLNTAVILFDIDADEDLLDVSIELSEEISLMLADEEPLMETELEEEDVSRILWDTEGESLIDIEFDMVGDSV
jgi:hypothetical protein